MVELAPPKAEEEDHNDVEHWHPEPPDLPNASLA